MRLRAKCTAIASNQEPPGTPLPASVRHYLRNPEWTLSGALVDTQPRLFCRVRGPVERHEVGWRVRRKHVSWINLHFIVDLSFPQSLLSWCSRKTCLIQHTFDSSDIVPLAPSPYTRSPTDDGQRPTVYEVDEHGSSQGKTPGVRPNTSIRSYLVRDWGEGIVTLISK